MNLINSYKSPNYQDTPIKVEFIVLHYTAQDLQGSLDIFLDPKSKVSCHLLIDEQGLLYQIVPCWNGICYKAFHAGKSFWRDSSHKKWNSFNNFSIGIEIVNLNGNVFAYTKKQYETLFQTLHQLKLIYPKLQNPDRIVGHENISGFRNKNDPGYHFDWNYLFKEVYNVEKPSYLKPILTQEQQKSLSFISRPLSNNQAKNISLLLEKKGPFWFKVLLIKLILVLSKCMTFIKNQRGQMIVEYILLLVISIVLALALIKLTDLTKSNPFLNFWLHIINTIAEDVST